MKKQKVRKIVLAGISVALVVVMAIAGTVAYLQGSTEELVNTFKDNKVAVELTETEKEYNIVPGTSETKDPKVTVNATLDSYVYVEVTDKTQGLVTYTIESGWKKLDGYDNVYYREFNPTKDSEGNPVTTATYSVLEGDKVSYSAGLTNEDMKNTDGTPKTEIQLTFQAFAIQKAPFNDPVLAYTGANPVEVEDAEALEEAIAEGKGVKLTEDISADLVVPAGKAVVIDLSGQTLSNNAEDGTLKDTITVENGATLTLVGNGIVKNTDKGHAAIYNNGNVVVEDGTFETNSYYLFLQHGEMTINGGTFKTEDDNSSLIDNGYYNYVDKNNERSGYVEDKGQANPKLVINGGTFEGGVNTVKNDDGGILEINGGTFSNTTQVPVFNVNIAIINGGTFNTPSGNDKTSVYNRKYDDMQDKGELTINGGTFNADYVLETNGDGGTVVINNGIFNNEKAIVNPSGGTMNPTIKGGTFKNNP